MALQVPFGQFLPGTTAVHTCDARVKLIIAVAYTFAIFMSDTWWAMGLLALLMVVGYIVAKVPFAVALRGLKPLAFILVFTVLANALTFSISQGVTPNGDSALALIGGFGFKPQGFLQGLYFASRIAFLVLATSLVTFTTSAVRLADALTSLMKPLRIFKVPVDDVASMFSIALRFIPTTAEEAEKIMTAQRARGVKFDQGSLLVRVRAWIPVLVPLFVSLFRRADELACAMEARCYTGVGRTRLNVAVMSRSDWFALFLSLIFFVAVGVCL